MTIKEYITKHEGREYMPYKCPSLKWTIGVGHNYQDNPLPEDIADYLRNNGKILDEHICINAGGWDDAARHLRNSLWFKQVGDRGKEVAQLIQEG